MTFSNLQELHKVENRLRITLSHDAVKVLKSDMMIFEGETVDELHKVITTKRINHIFFNYYEKASSSIYHALEKKKEELKDVLDENSEELEQFLIREEMRLMKAADERLRRKDVSVLIRLNAEEAKKLYEDGGEEQFHIICVRPKNEAKYDMKTLKKICGEEEDFHDAKEIAKTFDVKDSKKVKSTAGFLNRPIDEINKILEELGEHRLTGKSKQTILKRLANLSEDQYHKFAEAIGKKHKISLDRKTIVFLKTMISLDQENPKACLKKFIKWLANYDLETIKRLASGKITFSDVQCYKKGRCDYYYDDSVSQYVKAVIEEYTSLPFAEREKIYHKDNYDKLKPGRKCKITLRSEKKTAEKSVEKIDFQCFFVESDREGLYNYVAGYQHEGNRKWMMKSYRLNNIENVYVKEVKEQNDQTKQNDDLESSKKMIELRKAIDQHSIEYLSSSPTPKDSENVVEVVVEFTKQGEKMYMKKILHHRPLYETKSGLTYTFKCSEYQAETYFLRFGKEAKITKPDSLVKKLRKKFFEAGENLSSVPPLVPPNRIDFDIEKDSDGKAQKCICIKRDGLEYKFKFNDIQISVGKNAAPNRIKNMFNDIFESIEKKAISKTSENGEA